MTAKETFLAQSGVELEAHNCLQPNQTDENIPGTFQTVASHPIDLKETVESNAIQELQNAKHLGDEKSMITAKNQSTSNTPAQSTQKPNLAQQLIKANRDLESMVIRYAKSESDNLHNKNKIEELERKLKRAIKDNDSLANRVKLLTNDKNHLSDTLSAKVAQLTVLEQKNCSMSSEKCNRLSELERRVVELEQENQNLLKQIDTYKSKEADLLDFSERLSMKQMLLQTELDKALAEVPDYKVLYEQAISSRDELKEHAEELSQQLALTNCRLEAESKRSRSLADQHDELELKCRRQIEELENEIKLVRRKCQVSTRELLRRIKRYEPDYNGLPLSG